MDQDKLSDERNTVIDQPFESLVNSWKDMVYNTAISIVQHAEDAEDITQDVFIKVYQEFQNFRNDASVKTWIYKITVNKCLDHERKKKRQKNGGIIKRIFFSADEAPVHFEHPGVIAEKKEEAKLLFDALQFLPESQKIVFVLSKIEGLDHTQIASILGISRMAVESKMKRAKIKLSEKLKSVYEQS